MLAAYGYQQQLHGPSMFAVKAKIYGALYNPASSIDFDETSSYCMVSAKKLLISRLFIGLYMVEWFPMVSISYLRG